MNNNMYNPRTTLPESDDDLIQELGLDDGYVHYSNEIYGESRASSTGFEDSQRYQQTDGNSLGAHRTTQTFMYAGRSPTGINHPYYVPGGPLHSFTNFNQGSSLPETNGSIQDGYNGSNDINKLVENIMPDLDDGNEGSQDEYSGSNKLVDELIMDLDLNSFSGNFYGIPAQTTRLDGIQDNQQYMDNFQMVYQPTQIISYVDMSEAEFENFLY